ncbi:MAG: lipase [Roseibacillus sp.]|nr:lipase [Roseibacillus sp.]|tara:strand:- start:1885 stop:2607 length:723 start_codon:yes stop_codon:yes gene_type:complete
MRILVTAALCPLLLTTFSCSPIDPQPSASAKVASKSSSTPKGKVVLVHGIFDTRIGLPSLYEAIVDDGYECLMPSLKPVDGRDGLEPMAKQLQEEIDRKWGPSCKFSLVAFSMGGLISRYYLQELGGASRCQGLYTIATPHNGSYVAYLYPGRGTSQMRPESEFLFQLKKSEHVYDTLQIPTTSYRSAVDIVMIPLKSPKWHRSDNVRLWSPLHPALLWDKTLHRDLLRRLDRNREYPLN